LLGHWIERFSFRSHVQGSCGSSQHATSGGFFQVLDGNAEGWLRKVHQSAGFSKAASLSHGDEGAQLFVSNVHRCTLSTIYRYKFKN